MPLRRKARPLQVGGVPMGGDAPISVQSMARAPSDDVGRNLVEIAEAARAGAAVMRLAVPSEAAAKHFREIAARSPLPLVADTHFDVRSTIAAIEAGAAKVRINPGNMERRCLEQVVALARDRGIPIRIGSNSGSIRHRAPDDPRPTPRLMAEETLRWADEFEKMRFRDLVLSLKSHDARETVLASRFVAERCDYPLHLGVTAAGPREDSLLKSAAAIGSLLLDGIGDTIRFSFTGDIRGEVEAGHALLASLGLEKRGVAIIACPACGRCRVDLPELTATVKKRLAGITTPLSVAVMGCEVNGPGEARDADVGIASGGGIIHLFVQGTVVDKVPVDKAVERLAEEAEKLAAARAAAAERQAGGSRA